MKAIQRVLEQIREDEVVALTRNLVRIPSVYRPTDADANESRVAAFIRLIPHQADEYVETGELTDAARIYAVAAFKFLEGSERL